MDSSCEFLIKSLKEDLTQNHMQLKAVIEDIKSCKLLPELQDLNNVGRTKISALRKIIDKYSDLAKESGKKDLIKDVSYMRELLTQCMEQFKQANVNAMLVATKHAKEELFMYENGEETLVRKRQKRDKENLVKMSSNVTDQLLSVSRQLAETTQRSAATLDALVTSSDNVIGTQEELKVTSGAIGQSGKLLAKYGRRELTDKILMFFAFAFFIACVIYIVQKRLF